VPAGEEKKKRSEQEEYDKGGGKLKLQRAAEPEIFRGEGEKKQERELKSRAAKRDNIHVWGWVVLGGGVCWFLVGVNWGVWGGFGLGGFGGVFLGGFGCVGKNSERTSAYANPGTPNTRPRIGKGGRAYCRRKVSGRRN